MHPKHEVDRVLQLVAEGRNDCQISRATGIPRHTILDWRHGRTPCGRWPAGARGFGRCPRCDGAPLDSAAYAYLFGLYLGDGCISRDPRTYRLRIVQDTRYPQLIALAKLTITRVRDGHGMAGTVKKVGCIQIYAYWKHWPCLFPQHGPGRKHDRPIVLSPWQLQIVDAYPRQLLRGLIHSDGCRSINRVQKRRYAYPRYFFTNNSDDILQIFRRACDMVGVRHRNSKPNTISIAKRRDVAALDAFIGAKA